METPKKTGRPTGARTHGGNTKAVKRFLATKEKDFEAYFEQCSNFEKCSIFLQYVKGEF